MAFLDKCDIMDLIVRFPNLTQAKLEYDKTLNSTPVNSKARVGPEGIKVVPRSAFKRELLSNHLLRDRFVVTYE